MLLQFNHNNLRFNNNPCNSLRNRFNRRFNNNPHNNPYNLGIWNLLLNLKNWNKAIDSLSLVGTEANTPDPNGHLIDCQWASVAMLVDQWTHGKVTLLGDAAQEVRQLGLAPEEAQRRRRRPRCATTSRTEPPAAWRCTRITRRCSCCSGCSDSSVTM